MLPLGPCSPPDTWNTGRRHRGSSGRQGRGGRRLHHCSGKIQRHTRSTCQPLGRRTSQSGTRSRRRLPLEPYSPPGTWNTGRCHRGSSGRRSRGCSPRPREKTPRGTRPGSTGQPPSASRSRLGTCSWPRRGSRSQQGMEGTLQRGALHTCL
jgi:hypothetical protein